MLGVTDRGGVPYRNLIESTERDVLHATCNAYPMYGTVAMMKAVGAYQTSEPIRSGAGQRRIRLVYDWIEDADWGWKQVIVELEAARKDPRAYLAAHPHAKGANVELLLDKPFDVPDRTSPTDRIQTASLEAVAPLTAISVRHALVLSGRGADPGRCA